MFKFILLLIASVTTITIQVCGQTAFSDDFSDGNFTQNPTWVGETSLFQVNSTNQLQLNNTSPSSSNVSSLATTSTAINSVSWEFYVNLDFAPSSSNFARVYLVSDQQDLTQSLDGYFVQIGGQSGTVDDVSLFRQDGSSTFKLINGVDGTVANSPEVKIRVVKNANNIWELFLDETAMGTSFTSQGSAFDNTYSNSAYFGVYCRYTSTRSDKIFFDDIIVSGAAFRDTISPILNSITVSSNNSLELDFNEQLEESSALLASNYTVNKGIGSPNIVEFNATDSSIVQLNFTNSFSNGETYEMFIANITDTAGNQISRDTSGFTYFVPIQAGYRDLVINEIYPDFNPSIGLPEAEFIELFNASSTVFQLEGWTFSDGSTTATLSNQLIKPGEFLILCSSSDTSSFSQFGATMGLSGFPSLNNDADHLLLLDSAGSLIDDVNYTNDWYGDPMKAGGGYSLEQINPFTVCIDSSNFLGSNDIVGGTPGRQNSIYDTLPDRTPPVLLGFSILSADSLLLSFNETLDTASVSSANYTFSPMRVVASAITQGSNTKSVLLTLQTPLDSSISYTLSITGITDDCEKNTIDEENEVTLLLPNNATANDIVINEILFNPRTGGSDFVELFNRSDKIFGINDLQMARGIGGSITNVESITEEVFFLYPKTYLVLTESKDNILDEYPLGIADRIFEVDDLPSYNDAEGSVYLVNAKGQFIDTVYYTEDQHFALLRDNEGVSLERISADRPSTDPSNFHSAAETVGFATPGYKNSQAFEGISVSGKITIEPDIFSPDNDGFQDILNINYLFSDPGFVASVSIFDRNGRLIKRLVENELLGSEGTFGWDGIADDNSKARIGIYIVLIETFNPNGSQEVFKEVITVAGQLD